MPKSNAATSSFFIPLLSQTPLLPMALLVLLQALTIAFFVHPRSAQHAGALAYVTTLGIVIKYVIYFFTALVLALTVRLPAIWHSLKLQYDRPGWPWYLAIQLLSYAILLFAIGALIPNDLFQLDLPIAGHESGWSLLLLLGMVMTLLSTLLAFASASYWMQLIAQEKLAIGLALLFTTGIYFITGIFQNSWDDFLSVPTITFAQLLLETFYADVYASPATKELGVGNFIVLISTTCSGYEGIGMITAFLTWYSLTFRQDLKYPNALLLFPVAMVAMWVFNCIRIAALIAIGHAVSPAIAMHGFHSNAGWIYFLCVSIGMIVLARHLQFFSGKNADPIIHVDAQNIRILPEMVLLITTLLTAAWSAGFDWLYPVRVLATGIALAYCWKRFNFASLAPHAGAALIGAAVFAIWIMLVPPSAGISSQFAGSLAGVSAAGAFAWIAVRVVGATLIVPLAEELAFRGYLIDLLSRKPAADTTRIAFAWLPLIVSSACFGALHANWIAGTLAGVGFGLARYMRNRVGDAVTAHVVANGLLAAYVLLTRHWSYW